VRMMKWKWPGARITSGSEGRTGLYQADRRSLPDYEQVIPKDNDKFAIAGRNLLTQALRRMAVVAVTRLTGFASASPRTRCASR
jgi:hypothetical protein